MKLRDYVLIAAAVLIGVAVLWRYQQEQSRPEITPQQQSFALAPRFELYDQHSKLVKFERYLGRTELLIVFTGDSDATGLLEKLHDQYEQLSATGLEVVVVTMQTPHAIRELERAGGEEFPFPILTDIDMKSPIPAPAHRIWGLTDDENGVIRSGAFFVDRSGKVEWTSQGPSPMEFLEAFIDQRLSNG